MLKKSKKGVAVFEFIFCFFAFVVWLAVLYSSYGIIQSSILNSTAARNYAFVIANNRTNINFNREVRYDRRNKTTGNVNSGDQSFKQNRQNFTGGDVIYYFHKDIRFFGSTTFQPDQGKAPDFIKPARSIDFLVAKPTQTGGQNRNESDIFEKNDNNKDITSIGGPNNKQSKTTNVFLQQGYGICLNAFCGDEKPY